MTTHRAELKRYYERLGLPRLEVAARVAEGLAWITFAPDKKREEHSSGLEIIK